MNDLQSPDIKAKLAALAKPKAPKDDKMPVVSKPELEQTARKWAAAKAAEKDALAMLALCAADLVPAAEAARVELSRAKGEAISSIKFCGLTYQTQCRYSDVKPEIASTLKEHAPDSYVALFNEVYSVHIDVAKLTPELLDQLKAAGAEINVSVQPTRNWHDQRTLDPNVSALAEIFPEIKPMAFFRA